MIKNKRRVPCCFVFAVAVFVVSFILFGFGAAFTKADDAGSRRTSTVSDTAPKGTQAVNSGVPVYELSYGVTPDFCSNTSGIWYLQLPNGDDVISKMVIANAGYGNSVSVTLTSLGGGDYSFSGASLDHGCAYGAIIGLDGGGVGTPGGNVEFSYATDGGDHLTISDIAPAPSLPPLPSVASPAQYINDSAQVLIPIAAGGSISLNTVIFQGVPQSSSPYPHPLELQIEARPFGTAFMGNPTAIGANVYSGQTASVSLFDLPDGGYHWQERAFDTITGIASPWISFGDGSNPDFTIRLAFSPSSLRQSDFSSSQSEIWGSYSAAVGIASGTITEFTTTTAALGSSMREYLGWECDARIEDSGAPFWCNHYIPLTVATTTILGTSTQAYVLRNPHQLVDGDVQLFYVDLYPGWPAFMGFGTPANTTPNLSWTWTCGPYCRSGGALGGTSGGFVPYFEMGPQADPPSISSLGQSVPGGRTIQEGGTVFGRSVSFGATLESPAGDPLMLQVEIEPTGTPFAGIPTASSMSAVSTGTASVIVPSLADGGYHWAARAVDENTFESSPWTSFEPSGTSVDFTVQAPKEPVVFIPGIVGSRLTRSSDGKEMWPDIGDMLISPSDNYLDDLALASDGSQISGKEMSAGSIIDQESVLGISVPFYENTLRAFETDGYNPGTSLFAVPYDWRLGVQSAAIAIANTIAAARAASPDGKISIVGYSMGGLIAKEYLAGLSDASFVDKLILAGAPQLGSPEAFKVLNYGDNLGFQIPVVNLDILNHNEVKKIAQNMPSIYDLLPSRAYVDDAGGYVQDFRNGGSSVLDYDATNRLMVASPSDSRNNQLLTAANALHGSIDGVAASAPDVYNIVGCSEPTISGYRIYDNGVVDVSRDAGDGTVPLVSAMDRADGFKNYFISGDKTGITHASLVSDSRTLALITAILNGAASFTLPDGFSTSSSSCFGGSTVEFSAHGASGLMIQNNTGLSTGLDASGTVELGIPDSTYDAIGDNYFVIVPGDGAYHVTTESSSSDDLVVKAKGYDGSSVTQTATYVVSSSVPEGQGTGIGTTTVMLDFSDFNSAANVTVTENGNANSSSSSQNTSSTFSLAPTIEASASDIVPPDITISGIPTSAVEGNTTTVSFSAIDTDSGIASLKATLNGVPVGNGDVVTFAQEGDNVFRVEAMDGAGNPTAREVDFAVSAPKPTSSPVAAPPREISFSPIEDTYIDAADSDVNYGGSSVLRLRARGKNRAFAKFDQAAIENAVGSNTIVSANLAFTVAKNWENWAASGLLTLHRMTSPWIESGATWNSVNVSGTASWILEPSAMTTVSNDTTSTISLDVTTDVRAFLNGTEDDGWILQKADECAPGVIDFGSRESETPPVLTVTYVSLK